MSSTEKIIGASNNTHGTYLNELDNITCVNKIVVSVSGYKESLQSLISALRSCINLLKEPSIKSMSSQ